MADTQNQEEYKGPSKTGGVITNASGFGAVGLLVGGIPAFIKMGRGGTGFGWQNGLALTTTLAGVGYGAYRGYNRGAAAQGYFAENQQLKAENGALKSQINWADKVGKSPADLTQEQAAPTGRSV